MYYTPRQRLEIKGAFYYILALLTIFISSVTLQYLGHAGAKAILANIIVNSTNLVISTIVYMRKRRGLKVTLLPWFLGFTSLAAPLAIRYNHAILDGWTFASQSVNTTSTLIAYAVILYLFYQPNLYKFFGVFAIFNWILFLVIAKINGADFHLLSHINGEPVMTGLIILREIAFIVAMSIILIVIYRNISDIIEYDEKAMKQNNQIMQHAEAQDMITGVIREKTDVLFQKIDSQHSLINNFNSKMEAQAAKFSEMSATMEEIASSSDQIALEAAAKLV
ncbi:MAG: hypothetical protein FWG49_05145, partial [Leptospirales bacterium]|nr:hypothetical protein [Leptospirales bacterium]